MKESEKNKLLNLDYSIGLDIGTDSVGWAVVDNKNMNLVKRCKKHLWGSRLFDVRETAEKGRKKRTARRMIMRRKIRLAMLNQIFEEFIGDDNFFIRLRESFLHKDDSKLKNVNIIFDENNPCKNPITGEYMLCDADFYRAFPTIYHLRNAIIQNKDLEFEPKLIYLAVHHILKSRGNFINENIDVQNGENETLKDLLKQTLYSASDALGEELNEMDDSSKNMWIKRIYEKADKFIEILENKAISKKEQLSAINDQFNKEKEINEFFKMLLGYKVDLSKIFNECFNDRFEFSLSSEDVDEKIASAEGFAEFLESAKKLYSSTEYKRVMNGKDYISQLMIERYDRYKKQLKDLKIIFSTIYPKQNGKKNPQYCKFFNDLKEKNNYARFTKAVTSCDYSKFLKEIEKAIKENVQKILEAEVSMGENETVAQKAKKILICCNLLDKKDSALENYFADVELSNDFNIEKEKELGFLQRPRLAGNGIFPKQAHEKELNEILANQSKFWEQYLDEEVQKNIKALFNFKIDYFVGPLGIRNEENKRNFGWVVRNKNYSDVQITYKNYNEAIDFEKTRLAFITHMTGNCSYLIDEKALPKNSMIYSYFNVLNELCNISVIIEGKQNKLSKLECFNSVINRLLETNTYKLKDLNELILASGPYETVEIKGFANGEKLNSNLKPIRDMARIIWGEKLSADSIMAFLCGDMAKDCEDIIRDITIFGENKKSLKQVLSKYNLTERQINELCTLNYSGWGNLSRKLIFGIKSKDVQRLSILELMEKEKRNFISVYADKKFGFKEQVQEHISGRKKDVEEMIEDLVCSPSVKRGIYQSFKVVQELVKVMGHSPQNVFLEFARWEDKKNKGKVTLSRGAQIKKKYEEAKRASADLYKQYIVGNVDLQESLKNFGEDNLGREFDKEKVMLYFLQAGKCMYTGQALNIGQLSEYEVDHIVPRSLIKDDSLDNKVLVKKNANQIKSESEVVPENLKQYNLWKCLKDLKLLSSEKYFRLIRKELTDNDKNSFIKRQIVETRQIIKNTAIMLDNYFKQANAKTKIYPVKAEMNSNFRKQFGYPKGDGGRMINDLHHAKDAYITSLMGQYLLNKWNLDVIEEGAFNK